MPDPHDADPVRQCVAQARAEGRSVIRALLRDGWLTPADLEQWVAATPVWHKDQRP